MRLVIQRVNTARLTVDGKEEARIGSGAVVLLGVSRDDTEHDAAFLAGKTSRLRIYDDPEGKLNASVEASGNAFLVVSQFTLLGDCRKGNRPSYIEAAEPEKARALYESYAEHLRRCGHEVQTGLFREHMRVELENDGPVTLILESTGRTSS